MQEFHNLSLKEKGIIAKMAKIGDLNKWYEFKRNSPYLWVFSWVMISVAILHFKITVPWSGEFGFVVFSIGVLCCIYLAFREMTSEIKLMNQLIEELATRLNLEIIYEESIGD